MAGDKREIIMVVNEDGFFLSHRLPVALAAKSAGWEVTVICADTGRGSEIENNGLRYVRMPVKGTKALSGTDLMTIRVLMREFHARPSAVVHLVGLKMMLLGHVAARLTAKQRIVNAVCGLGILFVNITWKSRIALWALRAVSGGSNGVSATIFQNHNDEDLFRHHRVPTGEIYHTNGSGINLIDVPYSEYPEDGIRQIIFTGRMLRSKGVEDFCHAAEILRVRLAGRARFVLCGNVCDNPDSLTEEELQSLTDGEYIEWIGYQSDVISHLRESCMIVFPSYYREGLPKSLIEAASVGRAIVTTNSVGCRDTVENGVSGYLVERRSPEELAARILELVEDDKKCREMGRASRRVAEDKFDISDVTRVHLDLYEKVYENHSCNRET